MYQRAGCAVECRFHVLATLCAVGIASVALWVAGIVIFAGLAMVLIRVDDRDDAAQDLDRP